MYVMHGILRMFCALNSKLNRFT